MNDTENITICQFFCWCRYGSAVTGGDVISTTNEAYGKVVGVTGGDVISTSTNEAYGKVVVGEREEGYEMVEISHKELPSPPANLEGMYEVLLSPAPPSQPLPTIPPTTGAEENTAVYDVIPGEQ